MDDYEPRYRSPLNVMGAEELPTLPLSVNGSLAMARGNEARRVCGEILLSYSLHLCFFNPLPRRAPVTRLLELYNIHYISAPRRLSPHKSLVFTSSAIEKQTNERKRI